ncbi:nuclear transport factor 2 family protein [Nocardia sp. 348MFTsu5.1]|uniref:nuclear transport factor 2 family protein n=1 Tax=Nocardia sp. 348MFTsu5.1 TaxID=1172185 RepID=UPI0003629336|nr:nuclear transport factor 2 family protein [Nocardia sp. 348MFTsu5.1]
MNAELQGILDERAIKDVTIKYATALDTKNWRQLRECFTRDAVAHYGVIPDCEGVNAIIEQVSGGMDHLAQTQHILTNHVIKVDGDSATSVCYLQAQHLRDDAKPSWNFVMAGQYSDRLVRTADGWRISARSLELWWTSGDPAVIAK